MEDNFKSATYTYEELSVLKRNELNQRAKKLLINSLKGKNEELIERIINKTKMVRCTWDNMGHLIAPKETVVADGKRIHPVLGEWKKYIVEARDPDLKDETFANNDYAARIVMGQEVALPEQFAKFINNSCYSLEHYYDETKRDPETGKFGMHTSRRVADFFCREV